MNCKRCVQEILNLLPLGTLVNSRGRASLRERSPDVSMATQDIWISHLLRRAGFGSTPKELAYYKKLGYENTVEELINPQAVDNSELERLIDDQQFDFTQIDDLRRWWLYRMTFTKRPLEEKLTLFWHGHFATGDAKVRNAYSMYVQNLLLRKHALGNFQDLLMGVTRDPAMIVYLDNQQNRRGKPNENYAREVMELFTMGIGNYTERDVKEAARAFTGWQRRQASFFFNARQHDYGEKNVLGVHGQLDGTDVVRILAARPATARFLAKKLIVFFAHDNPDPAFVEEIASVYVTSRFKIRPMLKAIFKHPSFLSEKSYHAKIKSPVELVVGTLKHLEIQNLDADLPTMMSRMGQNIFNPPSVKGWDGGAAWVSTDSMMERFNFAARATAQKFDEMHYYASPSELVYKQNLKNAGQLVDYFLNLLVESDMPLTCRQRLVKYVSTDLTGKSVAHLSDDRTLDAKLRGLVHLIMTSPAYQLS